MWQFLERGGILMLPLVLASIIVVAIIIDRWIALIRVRTSDTRVPEIGRLLSQKKTDEARALSAQIAGPVGTALVALAESWTLPRAERDALVAVAGNAGLRNLSTRLRALEVMGRVAPLLGLLGTVVGLVRSFMTLSSQQGAVDPSLLADGIWQALLTTIAGLIVAIPAILFHEWCVGRIEHVTFAMRDALTRVTAGTSNPEPELQIASPGGEEAEAG